MSFTQAANSRLIGSIRAKYLQNLQQALRDAYVGKTVSSIPTPSLVIHADAADANKLAIEGIVSNLRIERAAANKGGGGDGCDRHLLMIRPHAKLHKSRALAERILKEPAENGGHNFYSGVCVQKVSEAEALCGYYDDETSAAVPFAVKNIFISNVIGTALSAHRLASLYLWMMTKNTSASSTARDTAFSLSVCVDSCEGVFLLAEALEKIKCSLPELPPLPVFIEVNIGQNRGGAVAGDPASILPILKAVEGTPLVVLEGLHAYHGGAQHIRCPVERAEVMRRAMAEAAKAESIIEEYCSACLFPNDNAISKGIKKVLTTITGAGTGTFAVAEGLGSFEGGLYNELQPGSYYVMDRDYLCNKPLPPGVQALTESDAPRSFSPALYVKSSVVSKTSFPAGAPARVIVDSGHKSSAIDSGLPCLAPWQLKRILEESESQVGCGMAENSSYSWASEFLVEVGNGGDDHGILNAEQLTFVKIRSSLSPTDLPDPVDSPEGRHRVGLAIANGLEIGDAVWLIPGHCDPTFNLHDYYFIVRGNDVSTAVVEDIGMVDARGCQQ